MRARRKQAKIERAKIERAKKTKAAVVCRNPVKKTDLEDAPSTKSEPKPKTAIEWTELMRAKCLAEGKDKAAGMFTVIIELIREDQQEAGQEA